ncbi:TPA: 1,4-beta-xylanase [Candidatus Sumerlaeota bacterium]|nr:1,4-beta-xylanase [Candidatus Sumerlaeota bacterium]
MKHKAFFLLVTGLAMASFAPCSNGNAETELLSLKNTYKNEFLIGVSVKDSQFMAKNPAETAFVKGQFNSITPENLLKWDAVHPQLGKYRFEESDRFIEFGNKNGMFIIGHTLVWHSQTADWVFKNAQGGDVDRETLLARMRDHIQTVVGRYKGRVRGWDVVNEIMEENGSLRKSPWQKIIGEEYIAKAFQFAHEADPTAELYYNDYRLEVPGKRKGAIALLRKLKAAGVTVTGVGLQGHYDLNWPKPQEVDETIADFGRLGLKVMITELDVDVLPSRPGGAGNADVSRKEAADPKLNPYKTALPEAMQQKLARRYAELFGVYLKHRGTLSRVTFWGLTDGDSWLDNFPIKGRTNYPLLFDRSYHAKPAYFAVIDAVPVAPVNSPSQPQPAVRR